ncbi:nuclease-related domain-containing protein [Methanoregula sp.]|uniref:nuclease-related domain-containing protein n=1 Tax=Methanoregula sp. TaxID=2052170 RepID=UPI0026194CBE|nr:nuclease-related domain-containing protein [Methanoregula sp.]MDD5144061.1 nuclease-related domain-containing protein [Methanoregula sp.]
MAHLHGISGSTRFLLDGTKPVHGRKMATLAEITEFLEHYPELLAGAASVEEKRQDEIIHALEDREAELNREMAEGIEQRTKDVYTSILAINDRIEASESFFVVLWLLIRFWGANQISGWRIHFPSTAVRWKLWKLKREWEKAIATRTCSVSSASRDITATKQFLTKNSSYLIGAKAEQQVIDALSQLPDDCHIMSGVNLRRFDTAYWWRKKDEIRFQQIDPVVIGPTGLFLIGTKNWSGADIELKTGDIKRQVKVATHALWVYMKDEYRFYERNPKIRCVIVSTQGSHPDLKLDKDIDVITLNRLIEYITQWEKILTPLNVERLTHVISFSEAR